MSARIVAIIVVFAKVHLEFICLHRLIVEVNLKVVLSDWLIYFMNIVLLHRLVHIMKTFGRPTRKVGWLLSGIYINLFSF